MTCQECPFFKPSAISNQWGECDDKAYSPVRPTWESTPLCQSKLNGFKFTGNSLIRNEWEITIPLFEDNFRVCNSITQTGELFESLTEAINFCDKNPKMC